MNPTLVEIWTHGEHKSHTLPGATTATLRIDSGEYIRPQLRSLRPPLNHCHSVKEANQRASLRAIERGLKYAFDEWDHLQVADMDDKRSAPAQVETISPEDELLPARPQPSRNLKVKLYTTSQYVQSCLTHDAIRLGREHFWDAKEVLLNNVDVVKDILTLERKLHETCDQFECSYHLVDEEQSMRAIQALRLAIPQTAKPRRADRKRKHGTKDPKAARKACRSL